MELIIIKSNDTPKVGDVVRYTNCENETFLAIIDNKILIDIIFPQTIKNGSKIKVVNLYIVDEIAEIKKGDYCVTYNQLKEQVLHLIDDMQINIANDNRDIHEGKVIATNNPSIPLPQLSKESIDFIINKNGILNNFNIQYSCKLKECVKSCYPNYPNCNKCEHNIIANIILIQENTTNETLEETAKKYSNQYYGMTCYASTVEKAFIAGANWYKNKLEG